MTDARNASRFFLQLPTPASGAWVASAAHLDRLISWRLTTHRCATAGIPVVDHSCIQRVIWFIGIKQIYKSGSALQSQHTGIEYDVKGI